MGRSWSLISVQQVQGPGWEWPAGSVGGRGMCLYRIGCPPRHHSYPLCHCRSPPSHSSSLKASDGICDPRAPEGRRQWGWCYLRNDVEPCSRRSKEVSLTNWFFFPFQSMHAALEVWCLVFTLWYKRGNWWTMWPLFREVHLEVGRTSNCFFLFLQTWCHAPLGKPLAPEGVLTFSRELWSHVPFSPDHCLKTPLIFSGNSSSIANKSDAIFCLRWVLWHICMSGSFWVLEFVSPAVPNVIKWIVITREEIMFWACE